MTRECEGKEPKDWLFPSYIDEAAQTTKNTSASAAVNKRIRAVLGQGAPADIKIKQRYLLQGIDAPSGVDWS